MLNTLLVLLLLTSGQIVRGLATRKFLSQYISVRHRLVFGVNGVGAIINLIAPLRLGDLFRFAILTRKKVGAKVSFYFLLVERFSDLLIANMLFFAMSFFRPDVKISYVNSFGFFFGLAGIMFVAYGGIISVRLTDSRLKLEFFRNIDIIFSKKSIFQLFVSLIGSWGFTSAALLILSLENRELLQGWVSVNSSYIDPYSMILNVNTLLIVALALPLALAYFYSLTIPSPKKLARRTLKEFVAPGSVLIHLTPFTSTYAGSGASLFLARVRNSDTLCEEIHMVRVENVYKGSFDPSLYMVDAVKNYSFPAVYFSKNFSDQRCTILEFITDNNSTSPSKNVFEALVESKKDRQAIIIDNLVKHVAGFHEPFVAENQDRFEVLPSLTLVNDLQNRIDRSCAYVFLALNSLKSNNRFLYQEIKLLGDSLNARLKLFEREIRAGSGHGDASLSNFLLQFQDSEMKIRSIDPNPRFQIANIEFDLAKIMQTTHGLYEFLINDTNHFPNSIDQFEVARSNLGWNQFFDNAVLNLDSNYPVNYPLMNLFFMIHMLRIAPYKVHGDDEELERYLRLLLWVRADVDI
jgi:hypothetical protein